MSIKRVSVALLVSMLSSMLLHAAEMQPRPEVPVWVSDGVTEYRLFIWVDNSGMGGEPTRGADWKLFPSPLFSSYVAGSSAPPVILDFFVGFPTNNEQLNEPTVLSGRWIWAHGPGPIDVQGNVGEYRFTIPVGTPSAIYTLELNPADTVLHSPDWEEQPYTPLPGSIRVVASHSEGITSCMNGPAASYPDGLACDYYDFDQDDDVDLADWSAYQLSYPSLPG